MEAINLTAFQEPRGVMRIIHFIFSICAFATITNYSGAEKLYLGSELKGSMPIEYPFSFSYNQTACNTSSALFGDFSSDAKFFVTTGVLAMLYSLCMIGIYIKFDTMYKTNKMVPLVDFLVTVLFGVLWLSSSAAWANGLTWLKYITSVDFGKCRADTSSFSSLNISVIFGFLNFFLWAADLWFLYKETAWFENSQLQSANGV